MCKIKLLQYTLKRTLIKHRSLTLTKFVKLYCHLFKLHICVYIQIWYYINQEVKRVFMSSS